MGGKDGGPIDNGELEAVMAKLEEMQDEALAVKLLSELNQATARLGKLLRNLDPALSHEEWKTKCDQAQRDVNAVIRKINQQG